MPSPDPLQAARDAAAAWLRDRVGVAGRWARLKADYRWMGAPRRGHWHPVRSHDPIRRTVSLEAAEETPIDVNVAYLAFSVEPPRKAVVLFESRSSHRRGATLRCLAVCPRGHEWEVPEAPAPGESCHCPRCGSPYPCERG